MARWLLILFSAVALHAQQNASPQPPPPPNQDRLKTRSGAPSAPDAGPYALPPEEDKSITADSYSFNPVQSKTDVMVGNEHFKAGKYTQAASRFRDATKWNAQNSEAWRRLGDAAEKTKDLATVKEAYSQYLKLEPDGKYAAEIKKKLAKLK
jgi:tetratricopeptide (TPR) repeat protein